MNFCRSKGIVVTAYSPLGSDSSPLLTNPVVEGIAKKYNVAPANILLSVQANRPGVTGTLALPSFVIVSTNLACTVLGKSVTPSRIIANNNIIDLTEEDIKELSLIEKTNPMRVCKPWWTGWGDLGFPDLKGTSP